MKRSLILLAVVFCLLNDTVAHQTQQLWHGIERQVRYHPAGNDIVIENGTKRFNRALYGGNTAFRAEAGDLPEFALYMPGMGGNLKFGLIVDGRSKWIIEAKNIKAIYRAGSILYEVRDPLLNNGVIYLHAIALYNSEGFIVKLSTENIPATVQLIAAYGGATGKKFSRDGDIGADPESSFYLKPEYCKDNLFMINKNNFSLLYGFAKPLNEEERYEIQHLPSNAGNTASAIEKGKELIGIFPTSATLKIKAATKQQSPAKLLEADSNVTAPIVTASLQLKNQQDYYFTVLQPAKNSIVYYDLLPRLFQQAEASRKELANRIKVSTPDQYLNTLGGALSIAADAIWEEPTYMHGAVAWRMRLPGWRGAYVADALGWHDRARTHFDAYIKSQLTTAPITGVVMDTVLNLARHQEKVGTQLFSDGYITRNPNGYVGAHHYDMNLGFVDQVLNHFNYTGDTAYVKKLWPFLKRHLAWEKKNFDADGDGLYDAYAAIWASDAMQYSGGGVTHSTAYNYRAFKEAARLAKLIGEDGTGYEKEAKKILAAINKQLWMTEKGWYAEFKDLLGNKLLHPSAGLWTIYHTIDSKVPDVFKAYQSLRYIDKHIPHIPVIAKGWNEKGLYLLSETNWQPYTWSLNNVVFAENLHTALAYWQGNRSEDAFQLWRSTVLESMYLSSAPGNFQQLSFYDAIRGELYRDFADGIGMMGRSLVEGLFGIQPDALNKKLIIKPGFPGAWNSASIETPDVQFRFTRNGDKETYTINPTGYRKLNLNLIIPVQKDNIASILVNGKPAKWKAVDGLVGKPAIEIIAAASQQYTITVNWKGNKLDTLFHRKQLYNYERFITHSKILSGFELYDPQQVLENVSIGKDVLAARLTKKQGHKTFFIKTKQGAFAWWQPIELYIIQTVEAIEVKKSTAPVNYEKVDLSAAFNDSVTQIFRNKYLSPRPTSPTLQLPVTGIGNWAYHTLQVNISDSGLRSVAGIKNEFTTATGVPFQTSGAAGTKNIVFTSIWDNYPDSVVVSLNGKASHVYFLMAGSTNPMQSRFVNGELIINYTDGTSDGLALENPRNWWPIEQDYYVDGFAFTTGAHRPIRVALKTGKEIPANYKYTSIRGFSNFAIDGGAATVLDVPLNPNKQLKSLVLRTIANDVVIGLMSVTLVR